jgi:hypothetical protein
MMRTSKKSSGEIVRNGRVFIPVYKDLLDAMPRDLVQEMARRRLAEIEEIKRREAEKAAKKKPKVKEKAKA